MPTTRKPMRAKPKKELPKMELTPETLPPQLAVDPPNPPNTITCTIRMLANGKIEIKHNVASKDTVYLTPINIAAFLPANKQATAHQLVERNSWGGNFAYFNGIIQYTWGAITAEEWATAFCKAADAMRNNPKEAHAMSPAPQVPVYVAWGNTLYKLTPDSQIQANDELAAIKAHVLNEAKAAAIDITNAANNQKDAILANANKLLTEIQVRINQQRLELTRIKAEKSKFPPDWLTQCGSFYRYDIVNRFWVTHVPVSLRIARFDFNNKVINPKTEVTEVVRKSWNAKDASGDITFLVNVPITDGPFNVTSIRSDAWLPHMSPIRACMAIGDCPARIKSADDLSQLADALSRAFSIVDLNSLATNVTQWDPRMSWYIPDELVKLFKDEMWLDKLTHELMYHTNAAGKNVAPKGTEIITQESERKETWSI